MYAATLFWAFFWGGTPWFSERCLYYIDWQNWHIKLFTERRRKFSLVARYSLKFTRCLLLVVKSLVTCCKILSLPVAEIARCKKSLVTRCKIRSLLVAEVARCKKSLDTRCKNCSLLVAKVESLFATYLKSDSSTGVFLWIFAKFSEHLYFLDICERLLLYNIKTSRSFFIVFYLKSINFWLWLNCS